MIAGKRCQGAEMAGGSSRAAHEAAATRLGMPSLLLLPELFDRASNAWACNDTAPKCVGWMLKQAAGKRAG